MNGRMAGLLALGGLIVAAQASSLDDYLKVRERHGITRATTSAALQTLAGSAVLEVQCVVKGTMRMNDATRVLLEGPGGSGVWIQAPEEEPWLTVPNTRARLIIRAEREGPGRPLKAEIVAALPEAPIAAWEREQARKAEQAAKRAAAQKTPPAVTRGAGATESGEWNLPPRQAIPHYADFILRYNTRLSPEQATEIAEGIVGFSVQYGVDARLITAMVLVESGFNPKATSPKGAQGLGQLMPGTARGMGVRDSYDISQNLSATVRLIRGHLDKYELTTPDGQAYPDLVTALAAYNAGSGSVKRYGGVPPYKETQNYIQKVIGWYEYLIGPG